MESTTRGCVYIYIVHRAVIFLIIVRKYERVAIADEFLLVSLQSLHHGTELC